MYRWHTRRGTFFTRAPTPEDLHDAPAMPPAGPSTAPAPEQLPPPRDVVHSYRCAGGGAATPAATANAATRRIACPASPIATTLLTSFPRTLGAGCRSVPGQSAARPDTASHHPQRPPGGASATADAAQPPAAPTHVGPAKPMGYVPTNSRHLCLLPDPVMNAQEFTGAPEVLP